MNKKSIKAIKKIFYNHLLRKSHIISKQTYKRRIKKYSSLLLQGLKNSSEGLDNSSLFNYTVASARTRVGILTTWATFYIAKLIAEALSIFNVDAQITMSYDKQAQEGDDMFYFVLTPMAFKNGLPDRYAAIQMEQTISDRWFKEQYVSALNDAKSVLDYSLRNIAYLTDKKIGSTNLFYTPVSPLPNYTIVEEERKTDVLFYGDDRCERRASMLTALSSLVDIKRAFCVYGDEMMAELNSAKIVVNIHYYEGAMLETTRICEALSHGCIVVSEESINDTEYPELCELIDFVPVGDTEALAKRLKYWLDNPEERERKLQEIQEKINKIFSQYIYDIGRVLFYHGIIGFDALYHASKGGVECSDKICIGSIDTGCDEYVLTTLKQQGFSILPQLKLPQKGSGKIASYCYASRLAMEHGLSQLVISDGALNLCEQFDNKFNEALNALQSNKSDIIIFGESPDFGQDDAMSAAESDLINPAIALYGKKALKRLAYGFSTASLRERNILQWLKLVQHDIVVDKYSGVLSTAALPISQKDMTENPRVYEVPDVEISVIVPCYNQELYIGDCLRSILAQSFTNYEVIVVNDGSSDGSWNVISKFIEKYPMRIKGINQPNSGVVQARNNAIKIAIGKYIYPLDGDDIIAPTCLEKLYDAMESGLCDVAYSQVRFFGEKNGRFMLPLPDKNTLYRGNCIVASAMYKRSDWASLGGYSSEFSEGHEDWAFWCEFLYNNKTFYRIDEDLFFYRILKKSRSTIANARYEDTANRITAKYGPRERI